MVARALVRRVSTASRNLVALEPSALPSSKTAILIERLLVIAHAPDADSVRILVFVQRRRTVHVRSVVIGFTCSGSDSDQLKVSGFDFWFSAQALATMLQSIPKLAYLSPSYIVGQGGYDGMSWDEGQGEVLRRFRDGQCRILVSTSVLQEGYLNDLGIFQISCKSVSFVCVASICPPATSSLVLIGCPR